ncbi:MAG: hypothetical protein BGO25_20480 [Acidobacteriales bacterium 59-55]|nr:MAG: hypothetical protein BGO25_20480 [Acidobacteriales bacterium 59-55]
MEPPVEAAPAWLRAEITYRAPKMAHHAIRCPIHKERLLINRKNKDHYVYFFEQIASNLAMF